MIKTTTFDDGARMHEIDTTQLPGSRFRPISYATRTRATVDELYEQMVRRGIAASEITREPDCLTSTEEARRSPASRRRSNNRRKGARRVG